MTQSARQVSIFREFLDGEASGGLVLMGAAALALIVANSPLGPPIYTPSTPISARSAYPTGSMTA
jgi:Na+/H+ antiporter NhaA